MSKFKVGDKVRVKKSFVIKGCTLPAMRKYAGITGTITGEEFGYYRIDSTGNLWWNVDSIEFVTEAEQPRREFIVIRRSGAETIAELRHDREVIKSAKATCAPSDTFDLDTGAKLAFDRLMGREEPNPAPQPTHRFKVGDRVVVDGTYDGEISAISKLKDDAEPYLVYCPQTGFHSGYVGEAVCKPEHANKCNWASEDRLSPAPAPEPPKFYTGKVFAEISIDEFFSQRDGHVFEFIDGVCINATADQQMDGVFNSFNDLVACAGCTKWHEVKE